jgi:hypothetical protein
MTGPNGDTFLTQDSNEHASMQSHGYRDGGIVGYISGSQVSGTQPLVRMTTGDGGTHFYTTSAAEKAQFQSQGWKDEGIVGYIWNQ